jgi:LacI family transcriptional regulator
VWSGNSVASLCDPCFNKVTKELESPTLQDVAERAQVSRAAASLALGGHPKAQSFTNATLGRIREAAQELGYRPNFFGSQLRRSTSQLVMVYVDTLQDLNAGAIAESLMQEAARQGYWTMVSASPGIPRKPVFDEKIIGRHGISAVVLISTVADKVTRRDLGRLQREGVRAVAIGRHLEGAGLSSILVDDARGGRLAAEHVYGLGARAVWLMASTTADSNRSRRGRFQAVLDYACGEGLPAPTVLNQRAPGAPEVSGPVELQQWAYEAMRDKLAASSSPPDAVITNLDLRAMGVYRALYEAGLEPGRDVAVVGYDDIWPAQMMHPSLSTVHQPTAELGLAAAEVLIDTLEGRMRPGRVVNISPELAVRDSTALWKRR